MQVIKPSTLASNATAFSRASTATYFNSAGLQVTAAANAPRFDYEPVTLAAKGLLIEGAATNGVLFSEDFSNAAWTRQSTSVTVNTDVAPDGTLTMDTLTATNAVTSYVYSSLYTPGAGVLVGLSCFLKAGTSGGSTLRVYDGSVGTLISVIQLTWTAGVLTIAAVSGLTGTPVIVDVGGGIYRVTGVFSSGAFSSVRLLIYPSSALTATSIKAWGAQLELTAPSSYIPTTSAAATRAADVVGTAGILASNVVEVYAVYSAATTYALADRVITGGRTYESLVAANLNFAPATNILKWVDIGPDNISAAFDAQVSTSATGTTSLQYVIGTGVIDTLGLINVVGTVVELKVRDGASGAILYSATAGMDGSTVTDWYQYFFFDPLLVRTQVVFTGIPPYASAVATVTISGTGTVSVGHIVFGKSADIGGLQYGATAGIVDYSTKTTDAFGVTTFVKRAFSKRMTGRLSISNLQLNRVQRLLYGLRATPCLWIGVTDPLFDEPLTVFGYYRDFSTDISYPDESYCSLEIEGLA